jgi:hypothetical protein
MRRPLRAPALLLALCLTVAACGSEDDGGTTADPGTAPTTEAEAPATTAPRDDGTGSDADDEEATSAFCAAWEQTAPAMLMVGLVGAFAELDETPGGTVTGDTAAPAEGEDVMFLLLSPKLEVLFDAAADASAGDDAEAFAGVADVMAGGVDRLRDAGLDDREITALREADLTAEEEPPVGGVDEAALEEAAQGFRAEVDKALTDLENSSAGKAFEALVEGCEEAPVTPDAVDVDVCGLLDENTVASLVTADPTVEGPVAGFAGGASCLWSDELEERQLAVTVAGADYYEQVKDGYGESLIEPVSGLGDEAFSADGFNYAAGGGTQGRSLFVLVGDRTLVVAYNPGEGSATTDQLTDPAREALASLG